VVSPLTVVFMSRFSRVALSLALAVLLTHCATTSGGGGSGEAVKLRFAWPEGLTVQVASASTVTQDEQPPENSAIEYQLRLEGKGEERRLISEPLKPPEATGAPPPQGQQPVTTLVLGPKGELLRIEGLDPIVREMAGQAESQGLPKEQQDQILALVRDALEQASRSRWEALAGKWNGLSLKPGEAIGRKSQTVVPLFGSTAATLEHVSLKERVPCTEGAVEKRCVRLVLDSSLDPEGLDQATAELLRKVKSFMKANMGLPDQSIPEMTVMKLRVDTTLELIAEPETLVPHLQRVVTSSQVVLQEPEGEMRKFENQSERLERFNPVAR
jgi:hypothetical protein